MVQPTNFTNPIWPTPLLPTLPAAVADVACPCLPLADRKKPDWKFLFEALPDIPSAYSKTQDYDFNRIAQSRWQDVVAPGSLAMQGFDIQNNVEYYYMRHITIPPDFAGKHVFVRFEGVYSSARVWINNQYVRRHTGGFTCWDCDITPFCGAGELTLVLGVTDVEGSRAGVWNPDGLPVSDASWASYYAHHNTGGILRGVTLFALPQTYLARCHLDTTLQGGGTKGVLQAALELRSETADMRVEARLLDAGNTCVARQSFAFGAAQQARVEAVPEPVMHPAKEWETAHPDSAQNDNRYSQYYLPPDGAPPSGSAYCGKIALELDAPRLWDAEHPNLYTLELRLYAGGELQQQNNYRVGFREMTYGGKNSTAKNKLYVNGREIKLRGVCRHDVSHLYGRSLTNEDIRQELLAYKRNNINHIRTSHYPASDYMLSVCDELGIYVEQENAACFKGANGFGIYNPPQQFVDVFAEMIESARNHASVIIWSLGNESGFEQTYAFRTEYQYAKAVDPSRPVIFSYPFTVQSTPLPYDIFSYHYKSVTSRLGKRDFPMLHDEFAHVSCYNRERLCIDNSSREAWGESIRQGWDRIFQTNGALGCAIWGAIDDVFYLPEGVHERHQSHSHAPCAGYGEWGCVLDAYKREKPEAYWTKKAFRPVVVEDCRLSGGTLHLSVTNRFDHADLSEVRAVGTDGQGQAFYDAPIPTSIPPHASGSFTLPAPESAYGTLSFYQDGYCVETVRFGTWPTVKLPQPDTPLQVHFDETRSLLILRKPDGTPIARGPHVTACGGLRLFGRMKPVPGRENAWQAEIQHRDTGRLLLTLTASGGKAHVSLEPAPGCTRPRKWEELGIAFELYPGVERVRWQRTPLYADCPDSHISRACGSAAVLRQGFGSAPDVYGEKPDWDWKEDMENFFLFAKTFAKPLATNDFKMRRNRIARYDAVFEDGSALCASTVCTDLNGYINLFTDVENQLPQLHITKGQYYPDLAWGNALGEKTALTPDAPFTFTLALQSQDNA